MIIWYSFLVKGEELITVDCSLQPSDSEHDKNCARRLQLNTLQLLCTSYLLLVGVAIFSYLGLRRPAKQDRRDWWWPVPKDQVKLKLLEEFACLLCSVCGIVLTDLYSFANSLFYQVVLDFAVPLTAVFVRLTRWFGNSLQQFTPFSMSSVHCVWLAGVLEAAFAFTHSLYVQHNTSRVANSEWNLSILAQTEGWSNDRIWMAVQHVALCGSLCHAAAGFLSPQLTQRLILHTDKSWGPVVGLSLLGYLSSHSDPHLLHVMLQPGFSNYCFAYMYTEWCMYHIIRAF